MLLAKAVYLVIGLISLILGIIGAFLPILPTVPFILLAAYCFARGYPPLYHWLRDRSVFATSLQDWERERAISRASKRKSLLMMAIGFALALYFAPTVWLKIMLLAIGLSVATFIATRPEPSQALGAETEVQK